MNIIAVVLETFGKSLERVGILDAFKLSTNI